MSLIRPFAWLAALIAVLGTASPALAQRYQPFIDPGYFDPDFQFFAPAEVGDYSGGEEPNTGVYVSVERMYLNVNRPDGEASLDSRFQGDFTWGNRMEIGYMTEDKTGWQLVGMHMNGPNMSLLTLQERLDRINDDDDPPDDPDPILQDRNPRQYLLETSLNKMTYSALELNKVWRRKEFHNGAVLEPIVGFRYMKVQDRYRRDEYFRYASTVLPPTGQPDPGTPNVSGPWEELQVDSAFFENNMFGGQLGAHLFRQRGHWLLSTDMRFFACHNFQYLETIDSSVQTRYAGPVAPAAEGSPVQVEIKSSTHTFDNRDMFVWGGELRAEAAYELTRDINLRFGGYLLHLGKGIGRGNNFDFNDQDVVMGGVTFGFTVNR